MGNLDLLTETGENLVLSCVDDSSKIINLLLKFIVSCFKLSETCQRMPYYREGGTPSSVLDGTF